MTSDVQGLVWGELEVVHEYDFDVENIIVKNKKHGGMQLLSLLFTRNLVD